MKDEQMPWYFYLAWFFAGAFLTNSIPHLAQGLSATGSDAFRLAAASANPRPWST